MRDDRGGESCRLPLGLSGSRLISGDHRDRLCRGGLADRFLERRGGELSPESRRSRLISGDLRDLLGGEASEESFLCSHRSELTLFFLGGELSELLRRL